jgi:hypothetical protein
LPGRIDQLSRKWHFPTEFTAPLSFSLTQAMFFCGLAINLARLGYANFLLFTSAT